MNEVRRRGPIASLFVWLWDAMNFTRRLVFNILFFGLALVLVVRPFGLLGKPQAVLGGQRLDPRDQFLGGADAHQHFVLRVIQQFAELLEAVTRPFQFRLFVLDPLGQLVGRHRHLRWHGAASP